MTLNLDIPRSARRRWWLAAMVIAGIALVTLTWHLTLRWGVPAYHDTRERAAALQSALAAAEEANRELQQQLAVSRREAQVFRGANTQLVSAETEHRASLAQLQAELDFYQRLTTSDEARGGLTIYALQLHPTESGQVFRYQLTLTQNLQQARTTSGRFSMRVEGVLGDQPATVDWNNLSGDEGGGEQPYSFKYFQQIEGYLTLPPDFHPQQVEVELDPAGRAPLKSGRFDWDDALRGPLLETSGSAVVDTPPAPGSNDG